MTERATRSLGAAMAALAFAVFTWACGGSVANPAAPDRCEDASCPSTASPDGMAANVDGNLPAKGNDAGGTAIAIDGTAPGTDGTAPDTNPQNGDAATPCPDCDGSATCSGAPCDDAAACVADMGCDAGSVCLGGRCFTQLTVVGETPAFATSSLSVGTNLLFTVYDELTSDTSAALVATIAWGDGLSSSGAVSGSAGRFTAMSVHAYAGFGEYTLTLTVTDPATGSSASGTSMVLAGITEYSFGDVGDSLVAGADNNMWFTMPNDDEIGRVTLGGSFTTFIVPSDNGSPAMIAQGPDGNMWFTEFGSGNIASITPAGAVHEYGTSAADSQPFAITAGPDGNIWFTERGANRIGRITTAGVMTEFPVALANGDLMAIAAGSDGNLWFTIRDSDAVGRITPQGDMATYSVTAMDKPAGITAGPDGNLWFAEETANTLGQLTPSGALTEFDVRMTTSGVAVSPDGHLWFIPGNLSGDPAMQIGEMQPGSPARIYAVPFEPRSLAIGPDGNLWMAIPYGIAVIQP